MVQESWSTAQGFTPCVGLVPRMGLKSQVAFGEQFPKAEHALYQVPYSPSFLSKDLTKLQSVDSVCIVTAPKQSL